MPEIDNNGAHIRNKSETVPRNLLSSVTGNEYENEPLQ